MDNQSVEGPAEDLTWREEEVLTLLAERLTNREIGDRLHLTENTVKSYVGNILSKLYVKNRREAVQRADALGLLNPVRRTLSGPSHNLPPAPTPFIGRAELRAEIGHLLTTTRLLTLTGPGGIGKTRLALQVAADLLATFDDGIFLVSLAPIRSAGHVVQTIAEAIGFPLATEEAPINSLLGHLRTRQLLLVMDNFEHLLDSADIVARILQEAPVVRVLATSREKLNLQGETTLNITGMNFPIWEPPDDLLGYDAIQLFLQSVHRVHPHFEPIASDLRHLAHICNLVQGMPLAIELAAAWTDTLSLDEIADELQKGLDILTTEMSNVPERHRSIRAVFDHSWSLMDLTERQVFVRLSVFRGGFTREAAQQVTGVSLPSLSGLVTKSILRHNPTSGRFEIHELLRQYAQERLEDSSEANLSTLEAHTTYYAKFLQQRGQYLRGNRQMLALTEIEADIENVRAAWRYCVDQRCTPQMWMFIETLWYVYWIRWWNHAGMELFAEAVTVLEGEKEEESIALRALAMAFQGFFMAWLDLADQGYELAAEGVDTLEQLNRPEALVLAYDSLILNAYFLKRYAEEIEAARKMLDLATEIGDKWLQAFSLFAASLAALVNEDYTEARQLAESNLNLYEEVGDVIGSTMPLIALGHVALAHGEQKEARGYYLRCLKLSEKVGFHYSMQTSSKYLGKVALSMGRIAEAERYLVQSLRITSEIGFVRDTINLFYEFARLWSAQDNSEKAAELLAFVIQHPASQRTRMLEGRIKDSAEHLLATLRDELSHQSYAAALERGQALELHTIVTDLLEGVDRK